MGMRRWTRALRRVLSVGALLCSMASCAPAATPIPGQAPGGTPAAGACCVGQRCTVNGIAFTVRAANTTSSAEGVQAPQPGQTLLVTDVTIENVGSEPVAYAPDLFRIRAADGTEYNTVAVQPDEEGNPGPGETVLLRVISEVPEGAGDLVFVYAPPSLGAEGVQVDLSCTGT